MTVDRVQSFTHGYLEQPCWLLEHLLRLLPVLSFASAVKSGNNGEHRGGSGIKTKSTREWIVSHLLLTIQA